MSKGLSAATATMPRCSATATGRPVIAAGRSAEPDQGHAGRAGPHAPAARPSRGAGGSSLARGGRMARKGQRGLDHDPTPGCPAIRRGRKAPSPSRGRGGGAARAEGEGPEGLALPWGCGIIQPGSWRHFMPPKAPGPAQARKNVSTRSTATGDPSGLVRMMSPICAHHLRITGCDGRSAIRCPPPVVEEQHPGLAVEVDRVVRHPHLATAPPAPARSRHGGGCIPPPSPG